MSYRRSAPRPGWVLRPLLQPMYNDPALPLAWGKAEVLKSPKSGEGGYLLEWKTRQSRAVWVLKWREVALTSPVYAALTLGMIFRAANLNKSGPAWRENLVPC